MPEPAKGSLLGIDYGQRTVGLAIAHRLTGTARPLAPIRYNDAAGLERQLGETLAQWRPGRIIVGLPLAGDGAETDMSRQARHFARRIEARWPDLPVLMHDERLTSHAAAEHHADRRKQGRARRRDAARMDSLAAVLILESWMAEND